MKKVLFHPLVYGNRFKLVAATAVVGLALNVTAIAIANDAPPATEVSGITQEVDKPVLDAAGNPAYIIMLDEALVKEIDAKDEVPARDAMDAENARDIKGWHQPKARKVAKTLEKTYGFQAIAMTSHVFSSVSAHLPPAIAERLKRDPLVRELIEVSGELSFAAPPPWYSQGSGNETISWGKIAVDTNDAQTSSTTMYVIDGGVTNHPDLNVSVAPINPYDANTGTGAASYLHATHVAGIVGAKNNNAYTRGINPGQNIISVHSGTNLTLLYSAIDWVLAHAEQNNVYGVANMSISHNGTSQIWAHNNPGGRAIRAASNRVLFVQAAGNIRQDACMQSFGTIYNNGSNLTANPVDGVVVVGGTNQNAAQQYPFDNSAVPPFGIEAGSNYGSCVEMWGPSLNIVSTWASYPGGNPLTYTTSPLSGTSMAVPHVAGLAARLGGATATPVQREYHLRARLAGYPDPGYLFADQTGIPIKVPQLNQTPAYSIPARLNPVGITASATAPGSTTASTQDTQYLSGPYWSAGSAVGWIEFDLGATRTIRSIRMTPEQSAPGTTTHDVYVGDSPNPSTLAVHIVERTEMVAPIARKFPDSGAVQGRYVRIASNATNVSWVSWREVEVYGN